VPKDLNASDSYLTYDELKAYQERQAELEWSRQLTSYAQTLVGKRTGQCVLAIRQRFGVPASEVQGLAKNTRPNTKDAKVGSVIIFKNLSKYGHVGIVLSESDTHVTYFDSNGDWSFKGAIRTIAKTDPRISGYKIINYKST